MTKSERQRSEVKRRITLATRVALSSGGGLDKRLLDDVSRQVGVHPHALRLLFASDDVLLDAVNDVLVEECAQRLRAGVAAFVPSTAASGLAEAALALAQSWPLDRSGMIIRGERRLRALRHTEGNRTVTAAERRFVGALTATITQLLGKLDRSFSWAPTLAVRVILDTYERSFEAWLLDGNPESDFPKSPYIRRTLPVLLELVSDVATDHLGRGTLQESYKGPTP